MNFLMVIMASGIACGRVPMTTTTTTTTMTTTTESRKMAAILQVIKYRRHTDPNGGYDQNEIKRNKALTYFKQNALYFGLQYKPSSGAEWKMKYVKIKPYRYN